MQSIEWQVQTHLVQLWRSTSVLRPEIVGVTLRMHKSTAISAKNKKQGKWVRWRMINIGNHTRRASARIKLMFDDNIKIILKAGGTAASFIESIKMSNLELPCVQNVMLAKYHWMTVCKTRRPYNAVVVPSTIHLWDWVIERRLETITDDFISS